MRNFSIEKIWKLSKENSEKVLENESRRGSQS